ncbi:MAG: 16S rRNA (guanine(527)-N(7))-methyltransferase RsmG [Christensenellaceae bacterium]|jgi:16S rRNA (guanine527-N7)-methyltransferase|nr:16S rRNA (guanine(527)-N(7))-methyltransferase RsmG [Christensenellaceae bacterium]
MKNDEKLHEFNEMLLEKNKVINLTAHKTAEESWQKNIADSLLFADEFAQIKSGAVLDIGSGGGLPAVPLAIVFPNLHVTMIDSVAKKIAFLNEAIQKLDLSNAVAVHARAENSANTNREKYDIVTAKAVAPLPTLLEYALPFLKVGGRLYAFKGQNYADEIAQSQKALKILGGAVERISSKKLNDEITRHLVVVKKIAPTPSKFPRQKNLPRTQPIM